MTTQELADYLSRAFLDVPLDCLPITVPPLSGEITQDEVVNHAEFIKQELSKRTT